MAQRAEKGIQWQQMGAVEQQWVNEQQRHTAALHYPQSRFFKRQL